MIIDPSVNAEIQTSVLCWLATVDHHGQPSVSPKEIWLPFDDQTIVIADIASANSVRNIKGNPRVCLSFVDIFRQRGYKLPGKARVVDASDGDFPRLGQGLLRKVGDAFVIRNVIEVKVSRAVRILAPSYIRNPAPGEDEMMQDAFRTYGVRPIS